MADLYLKTMDIPATGNTYKIVQPDGYYPEMTAGQITTNIHDTNSVPYLFRPTPFNSTRESGDIVGASVAWNQLAKEITSANYVAESGVTLSITNGEATISSTTTNNGMKTNYYFSAITGHRWFVKYEVKIEGDGSGTFPVFCGGSSTSGLRSRFEITNNNTFVTCAAIVSATSNTQTAIYAYVPSTQYSGLHIKNIVMVDLTLALGSTIADYIYTLESGTAGAGVAKLREWGFFTKPYYAYNAGGIESVNVSKHRMVGFNQWDEEWEQGHYSTAGVLNASSNAIHSKNFTPCFPNTDYYCYLGKTGAQTFLCWYDADKTFISRSAYINNGKRTSPANAAYFKMTTDTNYGTVYLNDICISIDKGTNAGKYEPYEPHEYPLDYSLTLRGILKLDGSNNLYADGDVYHPDGTVDRNWAERAYEAGDVSDGSTMITDGTTTVYKLQTPTTETADPYTEVQVCSPYGTEQFVDASVAAGTRDVAIPCGHNTEYMKNIVGAIEGIPLPPSANGTYTLKVTVASGVPTYSWVSG